MSADDSSYELGPEIEAAEKLLPAWFVPRMMSDCWCFGLLLSTGVTVVAERIQAVTQATDGTIWLDVTLRTDDKMIGVYGPMTGKLQYFVAPAAERTDMSINAHHVVAAFELSDT